MIVTKSPPVPRSDAIGGSFIHSHGTRVFVRPRLDVVFDAVQQARFNERKWVWVEHDEKGYIHGHILSQDGQHVEVELDNGLVTETTADKVHPMNPPQFDMVDDMADLTHLNEPSVIHNLTGRYRANKVYTYSGLFLVAVNPYRKLSIYSDESIRSYRGRRRGEMPPHIYTVADQAYHDMLQDRENQSILITGESGAGKTENTKIVIQYLTAVANHNVENQLEQQILQANPILESFGNAQTIRNNNSSRFGKFIRIEFNTQGQISGAHIEWYLLEKSRLHKQNRMERNYHVFYQLLNADNKTKENLLLARGRPADYAYTSSCNHIIDGVCDADEFSNLMRSMDVMGFSDTEKLDFLRIVAVVLHLGNVAVTKSYGGEGADIRDCTVLNNVCQLLEVPADDLKRGLLTPRIKAGRSWVTQTKSVTQVKASMEALAKTMYERNFARLVERVNQAIDRKHPAVDKLGFIGVLDIAGFEIFEVNSFEQLCINYTNEKLQQFFNHNMFVLEQEEYEKEKIEWQYINFGMDLQPTINLIEKSNPMGILSCLEEECVAPHGNETRFLEKLSKAWDSGKDAKYVANRFGGGFTVKHYAGDVQYSTQDWVEKNKDPLNEDVARLLAQSKNKHVSGLFEDYKYDVDDMDAQQQQQQQQQQQANSMYGTSSTSSLALFKLRKGSGSFRTVGQRHKQQLIVLMNTLYNTRPHFVRCILPNHRKRAGEIELKLVLGQLRCNGVLEGIRLCRKGYPNRLTFADFRKRYEVLCPGVLQPNQYIDGRTASQSLLDYMGLDSDKYRIGVTKIFFRATVLAELEHGRDKRLGEYITEFQAKCRGFISRRRFTRISRQTEAIKVMQRNARVYVALREWPWWKMYSMLKPLCEFYQTDLIIKKQEQQLSDFKTQMDALTGQNHQLVAKNQQYELEQEEYKILLESEQTMVRELQDSKQCLADDLAAAEDKQRATTRALQDAHDQLITKDKENDALQAQLREFEQQLAALKQENEQQATMIATLHQDIRECSDDNDRLAAEGDVLRSRLAQADKDHNDLNDTHLAMAADAEKQQAQLQQQLDDTNALLTHAQDTLAERQEQLDKETQEKCALAKQLTDAQEAMATQKQQLADAAKAHEALTQKLADHEDTLESRQTQLHTEAKERKQLAQKCTDLEAQLATQTDENKAAQARVSDLDAQLAAEMRDKKDALDRCDALSTELTELKKSLASESEQRLQWEIKNQTLQADWEQLTAFVKSEILESQTRASRMDQIMAALKNQLPQPQHQA